MIDRTQDLIDKVAELSTAIDDLPNVIRDIEINVTGNAKETIDQIKADLGTLDGKTVVVNVVYKNLGGPEGAPGAVEQIVKQVVVPGKGTTTDITNVQTGDITALKNEVQALKDEVTAANDDRAALDALNNTKREVNDATLLSAASQELLDRVMNDTSLSASKQAAALGHIVEAQREARIETESAVKAAEADAAAAKAQADSMSALADELNGAANRSAEFAAAQARNNVEIERAKGLVDNTNASIIRYQMSENAMSMALAKGAGDQETFNRLQEETRALAATLGDTVRISSNSFDYYSAALVRAGAGTRGFRTDVSNGVLPIVAFGTALQKMGNNAGGVLIPLGLAAFGITGLGVAIHLAVMGTFEFLAVFVPAMYAAAAAAAVMVQGVQLVNQHLKGLYTATEALGPMVGKTAGDMLGLGHSLQTAQNMANPGVFELLGEALLGANAAFGRLNSQGLSTFGQLGLDVTHMLDQFGAKLVIEIAGNMGKINSVLANSIDDLRTFGQIFGNLGHALLNFASAMPGAAELALHFVNAITEVVKWVSNLPPALLTALFALEEMYRWSGLVAGAFGILGRAIALVGTLGIPVFLRIGSNVARMGASIADGIAGMLTNFGTLASKIGGEGNKVTAAMDSMAGGMGKVSMFMKGPWAIAIAIAGLALAGLIIWALHWHTATENFISDSSKMVQSATNMNVFNVIGTQMAATTQKISQQQVILKGNVDANTTSFANLAVHSNLLNQSQQNASMAIEELTQHQQQLFNQGQNVVQGAAAISKEYGVSFTGALGIADAAGIKLVNGFVGQSKAAQTAQLQVQALVLGYAKMDQTGGVLGNTMNAINIQAGLQASKVQQVNQAWDQTISMQSGLTSAYAGFKLDLQQMGNIAQTTGAKINAFTGTTTMSVGQIANALRSFSGTSAQVWQAFDSSITQANSFMDSLRTAAAAGVVGQKEYNAAIAGVVAQLVPYAEKSRTAFSEVDTLAQEAGGPATTNISVLEGWIKKTGGTTANTSNAINDATIKMSNLTKVAQNFAGTLQTDVINAIAQAGVGVAGITGLTQKYTESLMSNGTQSGQTKQAAGQFNAELQKLGFTHQDITQLDQELTNSYASNATQLGNKTSPATQTFGQVLNHTTNNSVNPMKGAVDTLSRQLNPAYYDSLQSAASKTTDLANNHLKPTTTAVQNMNFWAQTIEGTLGRWPKAESTNFHYSASGGATFNETITPVGGGGIKIIPNAEGGVIPGYAPGHDSVLSMLSPGEGVLIPQAVRAMGGSSAIHAINSAAKHRFAEGGFVLPNLEASYSNLFGTSDSKTTSAVGEAMHNAADTALQRAVKAASAAAAKAAASFGNIKLSGAAGNVEQQMVAMAGQAGWTGAQVQALLRVEQMEAGFNPNARNPTSGAFGLAQFINGPSEYAQFGGNANTVAGQITGMINYIRQRYGNPEAALSHELAFHWYDQGGMLYPGYTLAYNGTGQPEKVTSPTGGGGGSGEYHVHFEVGGKEIAHAILPELTTEVYRKAARNNGNANSSGYWAPGNRAR